MLPTPTEAHPDPRAELDEQLDVDQWNVPTTPEYDLSAIPAGAPTWWKGDDEATDTFLKAMGVKITPEGVVRR